MLIEPADDEDEVFDLGEAEELAEVDGATTGLTTERTAESMRESLAALAMLAEPGAQPQIVRSGETSLEGLVRDMLRPMLAQWLETNLPAIVDRMVQAEIARIAGKKG
jgi:cell pole-organizing protein PopZ